MTNSPNFDPTIAHQHFSVTCFNQAWDLIEKPNRTPAEDETMLRLTLTSHWHWTQRADYGPKSSTVAYWQSARIYALLGQATNARRHGHLSLEAAQSEGIAPFYLGYAYEALARAEAVAGNQAKMTQYLNQARQVAETVPDAEAQKTLLADLETVG